MSNIRVVSCCDGRTNLSLRLATAGACVFRHQNWTELDLLWRHVETVLYRKPKTNKTDTVQYR